MTVEHSSLTGGQLHEPKGVGAAAAGTLGIAASSAISWGKITGEDSATASASSALTFTDLEDYLMVRLVFVDLLRATAITTLRMRLSSDNGSSYISTSMYGTRWMDAAGGESEEDTSFNLSGDNTYLYNSGIITLYNFNSATPTSMQGTMICSTSASGGGTANPQYLVGLQQGSTAMNAIQILSGLGNLTSGSVYLEGFKGS